MNLTLTQALWWYFFMGAVVGACLCWFACNISIRRDGRSEVVEDLEDAKSEIDRLAAQFHDELEKFRKP